MVSITHTQTRSLQGALYRVVDTVTTSVGIPTQVFVYATADQTYNRIATVQDMATYPDNRSDAQTGHLNWYRLATVTRDFPILANASAFASEVKSRLKLLLVEYNTATTAFYGEETNEVITS